MDGNTHPVVPGEYQGAVTLSVAEYYVEPPYPSVNRGAPIDLEVALTVQDGKIVPQKSVPAALHGGKITGHSADGFYLGTDRENFGGIVVDGAGEYTVNDARIEMTGMGLNDFMGMGAGIAALGDARVTINDSDIHLSSVTRCAVHAGGKSVVTANNCRMSNYSPEAELGSWSWGISVRGTNRLCQLADDAEVHYNGCELTSNGWGVLSVDGSNYAKMFVKDSVLTFSGPKNFQVVLEASALTGAISAAKQRYREGVEYIDETTREELCNVIQTPAPAISNGVIVELKNGAVWTAVGVSYLTKLTIGEGCIVYGRMTVNGVAVPAAAGTYTGVIEVKE